MEELLNAYHHLFIKPIDGQKGENVFGVDLIDGEVYVDGERSSIAEAEKQRARMGMGDEGIVPLGNTTAKITRSPEQV